MNTAKRLLFNAVVAGTDIYRNASGARLFEQEFRTLVQEGLATRLGRRAIAAISRIESSCDAESLAEALGAVVRFSLAVGNDFHVPVQVELQRACAEHVSAWRKDRAKRTAQARSGARVRGEDLLKSSRTEALRREYLKRGGLSNKSQFARDYHEQFDLTREAARRALAAGLLLQTKRRITD